MDMLAVIEHECRKGEQCLCSCDSAFCICRDLQGKRSMEGMSIYASDSISDISHIIANEKSKCFYRVEVHTSFYVVTNKQKAVLW
jgi:hypothetical protein